MCGIMPVSREEDYGIKEEEILAVKKGLRVDGKLLEVMKKNVSKNLENFI